MTDRAALIERIIAATEPSRELDVDIVAAFGAGPVVFWTFPQFSSSIDAALTLVMDRDLLEISMRMHPFGTWWVDVVIGDRTIATQHALLPLAIVLAALRMAENGNG
jgi:hypothetical protein